MNCDVAKSLLTQTEGPQSTFTTLNTVKQKYRHSVTQQSVTQHSGTSCYTSVAQYLHILTSVGPAPSISGSTGRRRDPKLADLERELWKLNFIRSTPILEDRGMVRAPSEIYYCLGQLAHSALTFCYLLLRSITCSCLVPLIYLRLVKRFQLNFIVDQVYKTY